MNSFVYYNPTKVVFQKGAENLVGAMLKENNATKVLVHYGSGSVVRSGLLDRVKKSIENANIDYVELGGVVPNPLLSKVYEGIEISRKENVDFILAVGGGSVIDSAKAIALGLAYNGDVWDFFDDKATPQDSYPVASILTLAATGSEMSDSCVITSENGMLKRYTNHEKCICRFSLMNPELMLTLPDYQTASGCVDILMHTMERYFNNTTNLDITDRVAEAVMKSVIKNAKLLKSNSQDIEARWNIMWAGSLSHNNLTGCGTDGGDWSTHNIEHELGGMFNVAHGAGLSSIWGSWARYVIDVIPHRLAKFAVNVLDVAYTNNDKDTALQGIKEMELFYKSISMPTSLKELGVCVNEQQIEEMAEKATHFGKRCVGTVIPLKKADIIKILENSNK